MRANLLVSTKFSRHGNDFAVRSVRLEPDLAGHPGRALGRPAAARRLLNPDRTGERADERIEVVVETTDPRDRQVLRLARHSRRQVADRIELWTIRVLGMRV